MYSNNVFQQSRLRKYGHVLQKDENDCMRRGMNYEKYDLIPGG